MIEIIVKEDCGNSPKKLFLKELNIAFVKSDISFITDSISDDISWNLVGDTLIQGKNNVTDVLEKMKRNQATKLIINNIITHGKAGAVNGEISLDNGKIYDYCDVYEFRSAKGTNVKSIMSYVIEIKE
jgi:hypothetical protein